MNGIDPATAAATVIALWDGIQLQWLHDPQVVSAANILSEYFRLVLVDPAVLTPTEDLRRRWRGSREEDHSA